MPMATTLALAAIAVPLPLKHAPSANAHHSARPVSASGAWAAIPSTTGVIVAVYGMLSTNAPSTADPNNRPEEVVSERCHDEVAEPTDHTGVDQNGDHREQPDEEDQRRPFHLGEYVCYIDFGDQQHGACSEESDE